MCPNPDVEYLAGDPAFEDVLRGGASEHSHTDTVATLVMTHPQGQLPEAPQRGITSTSDSDLTKEEYEARFNKLQQLMNDLQASKPNDVSRDRLMSYSSDPVSSYRSSDGEMSNRRERDIPDIRSRSIDEPSVIARHAPRHGSMADMDVLQHPVAGFGYKNNMPLYDANGVPNMTGAFSDKVPPLSLYGGLAQMPEDHIHVRPLSLSDSTDVSSDGGNNFAEESRRPSREDSAQKDQQDLDGFSMSPDGVWHAAFQQESHGSHEAPPSKLHEDQGLKNELRLKMRADMKDLMSKVQKTKAQVKSAQQQNEEVSGAGAPKPFVLTDRKTFEETNGYRDRAGDAAKIERKNDPPQCMRNCSLPWFSSSTSV